MIRSLRPTELLLLTLAPGILASNQAQVLPSESSISFPIRHALDSLKGRAPLFSLAAEFQERVAHELQALGFTPVAEYQVFVRPLGVRVREVGIVPA